MQWYHGWTIAGLGMLAAALSSPGQSFALSFYIEPLVTELGTSRLAISSLYSLATLAAAATLPLLGRCADRTTTGRYLGTVLLLMAAAMVWLAMVEAVWMLAIALFALRLLGQGAIGIGTLTGTVRWFQRRRGRAFAIIALGYAVGELVFPSVILGLFDRVGWRASLLVFAGVYALLFVPFAFRWGRDPRDRETAVETIDMHPAAETPSIPLGRAVRTPFFHAMTAVLALSPLILTGVIFHQVALFQSLGRDAGDAARAIAAFGLAAVIGTLRRRSARGPRRTPHGRLSQPSAASRGARAARALPQAALIPLVYGALLGSTSAALKISGVLVWPAYYGVTHVGSIKGTVTMIRNAATAAGAPLAAILAGPAEQFDQMLLPFAAIAAAGSVLLLFLPRPRSVVSSEMSRRKAA